MTDPKEPTDRDEIEKLASEIFELEEWHYKTFEELPSDLQEYHRTIAEHILANFVPRTEHERIVADLKEEVVMAGKFSTEDEMLFPPKKKGDK